MNTCIFCKIIAHEIPAEIIRENEDVLVIKDISPKAPVHYLIIPKKHIQDTQSLAYVDLELAGELLIMARDLSQTIPEAREFKLVVNNGAQAGQRVFHLHVHFLAGRIQGEL